MKIRSLQSIFPNVQLQSAMKSRSSAKFREREFSKNLLKQTPGTIEQLLTQFLQNIQAQQATSHKKEAARLLHKFTKHVQESKTVLPPSVQTLLAKITPLFKNELKKLHQKDIAKQPSSQSSSSSDSFGRYPEADLKLREFSEHSRKLDVIEKARLLLEEHSSKDPDLIKKRAHHKKLRAEQEKTGKFSEKGNEFEVKYPDSQRMLLMPQPLPKEYDAFCDMLIDKKVALIMTLCSPYEGEVVMPYYDPAMMNPKHLSTHGRKINCLSQKVLYEGPEAAPVPKVQKLIDSSKVPVNLRSESLKMWRPQVVLYKLQVTNKTGSHELHLLHYKNWPDGKFASDLKAVDVLFEARDKLLQNPDKPMLIHCKAGIGRTGNVALIDWARMRIKNSLAKGQKIDDISINLPEMFYDFRRFRPKVGSGHKQIAKVYEVLGNHYDKHKSSVLPAKLYKSPDSPYVLA